MTQQSISIISLFLKYVAQFNITFYLLVTVVDQINPGRPVQECIAELDFMLEDVNVGVGWVYAGLE